MLRPILPSLALSLFGLVACGGSDQSLETGHLDLVFAFGERDCSEVGVGRILVELEPERGGAPQSHEFTCDYASSGDGLLELEAGSYRASMQGLGPEGEVRYSVEDVPVAVEANESVTERIVAPGITLTLHWNIEGAVCGDVESLWVQLWDPEGRDWSAGLQECAPQQARIEGLYPGVWKLSVTVDPDDGSTIPLRPFSLELARGDLNEIGMNLER